MSVSVEIFGAEGGVEPTRPYGQRILSPTESILPDLTKWDELIFTGLAAVKVLLRPVTSRDTMSSSMRHRWIPQLCIRISLPILRPRSQFMRHDSDWVFAPAKSHFTAKCSSFATNLLDRIALPVRVCRGQNWKSWLAPTRIVIVTKNQTSKTVFDAACVEASICKSCQPY